MSTLPELVKLVELLLQLTEKNQSIAVTSTQPKSLLSNHPMLGKRCLIRTYSAGVHIGDVVYVDGMEVKLLDILPALKG